ncbi:MAG: hypothetical protein ACRDLO_04205, partial [Solirubrobacterales bacterium]
LRRAADDPAARRYENARRAREDAERDLAASERQAVEAEPPRRGATRDFSRIRGEMARERVERIAAEERSLAGEVRPVPAVERERRAGIERVFRERRRLATEAAIRLEPRYITEAIGQRPEGIRERLQWDRAVERIEELRQELGIRDRQRAFGREPRERSARLEWRRADRELGRMQERLLSREARRELGRAQVLAKGLGR